jgi:predicted dehydrogenase
VEKLAWGIIGTGGIARQFAAHLPVSQTGVLAAVGSRTQKSADEFAAKYGGRAHGSYEALLADPQVQAVYISTPHPMHARWSIEAARAGKHILCEKPLAMNRREAKEIIDAARENDVFLMEAYMYRCHPQTQALAELLRQRVIGEVRVIRSTFSYQCRYDPAGRLLNPALGGGGILDVGGYCVSVARLAAGAALGKPFAEPLEILAAGHVGQTGVDEWAAATLRFEGDIIAQLFCGTQVAMDNQLQVFGSEGSIRVDEPWKPSFGGGTSRIVIHRKGAESEQKLIEAAPLYAVEADNVAQHLARRQSPAMSWDDTLGNMAVLDRWLACVGVSYPGH